MIVPSIKIFRYSKRREIATHSTNRNIRLSASSQNKCTLGLKPQHRSVEDTQVQEDKNNLALGIKRETGVK